MAKASRRLWEDPEYRRRQDESYRQAWQTHKAKMAGDVPSPHPGGRYNGFTHAVRQAVRQRDKVCRICGGTRSLDVHHLNYDKHDPRMENLVLLCKPCHMKYHRKGAWPIDLGKWVGEPRRVFCPLSSATPTLLNTHGGTTSPIGS